MPYRYVFILAPAQNKSCLDRRHINQGQQERLGSNHYRAKASPACPAAVEPGTSVSTQPHQGANPQLQTLLLGLNLSVEHQPHLNCGHLASGRGWNPSCWLPVLSLARVLGYLCPHRPRLSCTLAGSWTFRDYWQEAAGPFRLLVYVFRGLWVTWSTGRAPKRRKCSQRGVSATHSVSQMLPCPRPPGIPQAFCTCPCRPGQFCPWPHGTGCQPHIPVGSL